MHFSLFQIIKFNVFNADADVFNNICGMLRDTGIAMTPISFEWAGAEFSALLKSCSPL